MKKYQQLIILSVIYYIIYLFLSIQLIPFVITLFNNSQYHSLKIAMTLGPLPIDYLLMLLLATVTNYLYQRHQMKRGRNG